MDNPFIMIGLQLGLVLVAMPVAVIYASVAVLNIFSAIFRLISYAAGLIMQLYWRKLLHGPFGQFALSAPLRRHSVSKV